jgi:hypothetical protein
LLFKNTLGKKIRSFNVNRLKKEIKNFTAEEIYKDYLNSIKLANDIANLHEVKIFFYLQPTAFSRKNPMGVEKTYHSTKNSETAREVYKMIRQEITTKHFYDLSSIFDTSNDQFFYDHGHLSKKGNLVISDKIYKTIFDENGNIN